MAIYQLDEQMKVKDLFQGWNETMIWSYLDGSMGICYVDRLDNPQSAQIIIADFCFFAGVLCEELVRNIQSEYVIMVPQNKAWGLLIESVYGTKAIRRERYATFKEKDVFDKGYLESLVRQLDHKYEIRSIDKPIYEELMTSSYEPFHDLCGQFLSYADYQEHGLGFVIKDQKQIIAGASSYTYYQEGIEIEVDTHPQYRQQGFAKICAAKLILECLDRNLYPSWDAHNQISLALSQKLGYHKDYSYLVYEVLQ